MPLGNNNIFLSNMSFHFNLDSSNFSNYIEFVKSNKITKESNIKVLNSLLIELKKKLVLNIQNT